VANLGDSQAVIFQEDKFVELSNLHDFKNEQERLNAEQKGGTVINNRLEGELAVSRSIGDVKFKLYMSSEPEIASYKMTEKDEFLLLASDGFWNVRICQIVINFDSKLLGSESRIMFTKHKETNYKEERLENDWRFTD